MKIGILGCGWLGLPLAKELLKNGHTIHGSTTSAEKLPLLSSEGIAAFLLKVTPQGLEGESEKFFKDVETLIVDFPPGLRKDPGSDYAGAIQKLNLALEKSEVKRLIFVSSTSVYEETETFPEYSEEDPPNAGGPAPVQLIIAEQMLLENRFLKTAVVRFGGLLGEDRHPVKYLAGRNGLVNPHGPVNLIHRNDCIGIIKKLLEEGTFKGVFNAVFPEHPSRKEYYQSQAKKLNLPLPQFDEISSSKGKIVCSRRVENKLRYNFQQEIDQ